MSPWGDTLQRQMDRLRVREADLVERFVRGSGPGGQKVNKTASCVYLKHRPSGIDVHCQQERSRERNRVVAREWLCQRLEVQQRRQQLEKDRRRAVARVKARGRSKGTKRKIAEQKRQRSEKKSLRRRINPSD
jgi:protein subunit release factor B